MKTSMESEALARSAPNGVIEPYWIVCRQGAPDATGEFQEAPDAEWRSSPLVPGEETLYRFLRRLLGMKECPLRVWRFSSKEYLNSPQILRSLGEPRFCIHGSDRIKRHAEASLL